MVSLLIAKQAQMEVRVQWPVVSPSVGLSAECTVARHQSLLVLGHCVHCHVFLYIASLNLLVNNHYTYLTILAKPWIGSRHMHQ